MSCIRHSILKRGLLFLLIEIVVSKEKGKGTSSTEFLQELRENIEAYRNFQSIKTSLQYSTFHLMNKKIAIKDCHALYETLFGEMTQKKMFTVITIMKTSKNQSDASSKDMSDFIKAIKEHLSNPSVNVMRVNNLQVTVEYITSNCVDDFNTLSNTCENIKLIYSKLQDYLVKSFVDLICEIFKKKLLDWVRINPKDHLIVKSCYGKDEIDEEKFEKALVELRSFMLRPLTKNNLKGYINDIEFAFTAIKSKILKFEGQINFKYFTYDLKNLKQAITNFLSKFNADTLNQIMIKAVYMGLELFENDKNRTIVIDLFKTSVCVERHTIKIDNNSNESERWCETCETEVLDEYTPYKQYSSFMNSFGFDKMQQVLREKNQMRLKKICVESLCNIKTQIVFDVKLSIKNLFSLIYILNGTEFFTRLSEHQTLIIDTDRKINSNTENIGDSKYSQNGFLMSNGERYIKSSREAYKIYSSTVHPDFECVGDLPKKKLSALGVRNRENDYPKKFLLNTSIFIEEHKNFTRKKIGRNALKPLENCLTKNCSKFMRLHKLNVICGTNESSIYILDHFMVPKKAQKVSILFDMETKIQMNGKKDQKRTDKHFMLLDNVPKSILAGLNHYLKNILLAAEPDFKSFNFGYEANNNFTHAVNATKIYATNPLHFVHLISDNIARLRQQKVIDSISLCSSMALLARYAAGKYDNDKSIMSFIKKSGLEPETFDNIMKSCILKLESSDASQNSPGLEFIEVYDYWLKFIMIHHENGANVLHICIIDDYDSLCIQSAYPINVMSKIYEHVENEPIPKLQESRGYCVELNKSIISLLINYLVMNQYFDELLYNGQITCANSIAYEIFEKVERQLIVSEFHKTAKIIGINESLPEKYIKLAITEIVTILEKIYMVKKQLSPKPILKIYSFFIKHLRKDDYDEVKPKEIDSNIWYKNLEHLELSEEYFREIRKE